MLSLTPNDCNLLLIYSYSRYLLKPDFCEYPIVHQTSPQAPQLMSRTKLNIFLLSLASLVSLPSKSVYTSQNITTIHLIVLTRNLGAIYNSSPYNQSLKSFDSSYLFNHSSLHSFPLIISRVLTGFPPTRRLPIHGSHFPKIKI